MTLREGLEKLRLKPTEYHYICWGGSTVCAIDEWSKEASVVCRRKGTNDWPRCKECDGKLAYCGMELHDYDRDYNRAIDDAIALLSTADSEQREVAHGWKCNRCGEGGIENYEHHVCRDRTTRPAEQQEVAWQEQIEDAERRAEKAEAREAALVGALMVASSVLGWVATMSDETDIESAVMQAREAELEVDAALAKYGQEKKEGRDA